ncbi:hypothetical protein [Hydrocarboniphaga sp.]|uniref:hypothetical protein n=1 Tax=Hydrocarboniphaga sp. TaxID=2033016 RepID=UPI003D0A9D13
MKFSRRLRLSSPPAAADLDDDPRALDVRRRATTADASVSPSKAVDGSARLHQAVI